MVAALPLAWRRARLAGSWWWFAVLVLAAAAWLTGSLTIRAVLAWEVIVCAVVLVRDASSRRLRAAFVGTIVAGLAGVSLLSTLALVADTTSLPAPIGDIGGLESRREMWGMAASVVAENPWLGVGPDGFALASQDVLSERLVRIEGGRGQGTAVFVRDPHSILASVPTSLGIIGTLVFVAASISWIGLLASRLGRRMEDEDTRLRRLSLAIASLGFLACMLLIPWSIRFAAMPALLIGSSVAPTHERRTARGRSVTESSSSGARSGIVGMLSPYVATWGAVFGAGLLTLLAVTALTGDALLASAKSASDVHEARRRLDAAIAIQPTRQELRYERLWARGYAASVSGQPLDDFRQAADDAPAPVRENAAYVAGLVQLSLDEAMIEQRDALEWERNLVERAATLSPNHPDVILEQLHLALVSGDLQDARSLLERTGSLRITNPRRWLYAWHLADLEGDTKAAAEARDALSTRAPWLMPLGPS
jgi:hypothetical protein